MWSAGRFWLLGFVASSRFSPSLLLPHEILKDLHELEAHCFLVLARAHAVPNYLPHEVQASVQPVPSLSLLGPHLYVCMYAVLYAFCEDFFRLE